MMKFISSVILTAICASAVSAQAPSTIAPAMKALIDRQFAAIDANHDGTISRAEFDGYAAARVAQQDREFEAAFTSMDINRDGKISMAEAKANPPLAQNFAAVDTDHDQMISRAELHAAMLAAQSAGLAGNGE